MISVANTSVIPVSREDEPQWKERYRSTTERAKQGGIDLAFLGDSITQLWDDVGQDIWQEYYGHRKSINLGLGGDRTEHVIWRLQNGNLGNIQPKVVVVLIGTNNTGHLMQDPDEVAAGIKLILKILKERLSQAKVVLHGVFPRGFSPTDPGRVNNLAINQRIQHLADGMQVDYLDIGSTFLELDGTISESVMPDALHLSPEGYRRWAEALEPKLKSMGV